MKAAKAADADAVLAEGAEGVEAGGSYGKVSEVGAGDEGAGSVFGDEVGELKEGVVDEGAADEESGVAGPGVLSEPVEGWGCYDLHGWGARKRVGRRSGMEGGLNALRGA